MCLLVGQDNFDDWSSLIVVVNYIALVIGSTGTVDTSDIVGRTSGFIEKAIGAIGIAIATNDAVVGLHVSAARVAGVSGPVGTYHR